MKKKIIKVLSVLVIFFSFQVASAQIYVKVRPIAPTVVVTAQPTPAHVWVNEEWEPYGDNYRYAGGYWVAPPHPGYHYRAGYWKEYPEGHRWHRGEWRK